MFNTRIPILAGVTTVVLLALIGGLATAAPGAAPEEPTKGAAASVAGANATFADPLTEAGRWEWTGGGAFSDIFFVDSTYGWAVGPGVWRTTDGGITWRHLGPVGGTTLQRVVFANRLRGWVRDSDGRIYRTDDGGETWALKGYFPADMPALAAVGTDDVWTSNVYRCPYSSCCGYGSVSHSADGGASWHQTLLYFGVQRFGRPGFHRSIQGWAVLTVSADGYSCDGILWPRPRMAVRRG